jgi:Zn-dependent protease with chaperone function
MSVPNAFALPGGTILVTTGMIDMCDSEAELASVIAHEMGHHKLGHPLARIQYERVARKLGGPLLADLSTLGYMLYSRGYSARDEEEADRQGLGMAAGVDYHPQAARHLMARMQTRFGRPEATPGNVVEEGAHATGTALRNYFATHPPFPDRILKLERARVEMHLPVDGRRWFLGSRNHRERIPSLQRRLDEDFQVGPLE